MLNHFKKSFFNFRPRYLILLSAFFILRCFNFNAQKNDNQFFFSPSDINISFLNQNNILNLPLELKITKKGKEVLNFLCHLKQTEYSYIDNLIFSNKLSSKFGFLPLILSGYQNYYITNFSGKGIWSLSYITALKTNLKVNSYMDQRLDEKASTLAAIDHLKQLSKIYKSDNWTLLSFITSPNYVSNIMKEAKSNIWDDAIKFIDQKYLFNLELINWLDKIKYIPTLIQTDSSKLNKFIFEENIYFDAIAQFKILDFLKIKRENPVLLGQIIPKGHSLYLENEVGKFLKKNIQKILSFQDSMIQNLFLDTIKINKKIYIVKEGDFLGQIAIDNNVSVKEIMSWNDLKSTIIYKDQNLILMPKAQSHNDKLFPLKINKQKYFWEVAAVYAKTSIKTLCNYNFYHELKPNQKLIIIKK